MFVSTRENSDTGYVQVLRVMKQWQNYHDVSFYWNFWGARQSKHELYCAVLFVLLSPQPQTIVLKSCCDDGKLDRVKGGIYRS
jgi:hypothetical protein